VWKDKLIVCADIPLDSARYRVKELLEIYRTLAQSRGDVHFFLAGKRTSSEAFSVWNFIDENEITDRVSFLPYYERCNEIPVKKVDCWRWIGRDLARNGLSVGTLLSGPEPSNSIDNRFALFVTCFHPERYEGNTRLMRQWLNHLKAAGYRVHLLYYATDPNQVTTEMRARVRAGLELYREVAVTTKLVGINREGLNVHVDDWCGKEALDAASELASQYEYDVAIVNYPFMTAIFNCLASYTKKILITHDSFTDRNRRMYEQGYSSATWVSLDRRGEQEACDRADIVVALQEHEAEQFGALCGDLTKIRVVSPVFPLSAVGPTASASGKLRIGYFGSGNWVNEQNLALYLRAWLAQPDLSKKTEIVLAGGVCAKFADWVEDGTALLEKVAPTMLGKVVDLNEFFICCDVVVNPERGGTGIKIKTLEAMAANVAVLSTAAGSLGIGSESRFHAAADAAALAQLTAEIANDRSLLQLAHQETTDAYRQYSERNQAAMVNLLGPIRNAASSSKTAAANAGSEPLIPDYVARNATDYQIAYFKKFFARMDIQGKRILEIDSDYHLATARLFAANGASEVVAVNLGDWKSPEPLPDNVKFRIMDICDFAEEEENGFDVVYGIAILEHLENPDEAAKTVWKLLKPDGAAYLQGAPLWTSSLGHHVWVSSDDPTAKAPLYAFSIPELNPIPNWAHLAFSPPELSKYLHEEAKVSPDHAQKIVNFVYNLEGNWGGSCSSFRTPTQVLNAFNAKFRVEAIRVKDFEPNEYCLAAATQYSMEDLGTIGLELWLSPKFKRQDRHSSDAAPLVSLIVPFYNVESYVEECIVSIVSQDYDNIEFIFVDDVSPDGTRAIIERYAAIDPRIMIITHEKNQGLGPARNTGVRYASGEYLFFLDSDDFLTSRSAVSSLVNAARNYGNKIIVGSCVNLFEDGRITDRDLLDSQGSLNASGGEVKGVDAFLAGLRFPNGYYLPPRAWGALINRKYYSELGLDYPPGEHEDMGHTPFIYAMSGGVLFVNDVVVTYRIRSGSISQTPWSRGHLQRYRNLWRRFNANVQRFSLDEGLSGGTLQLAWHMLWRMQTNKFEREARQDAIDLLEEMLKDVTVVSNSHYFFYVLDYVREFLGDSSQNATAYRRVMSALPHSAVLDYYYDRLGVSRPPSNATRETPSFDLPEATKVEASGFGTKVEASGFGQLAKRQSVGSKALTLEDNSERAAAIFDEFGSHASEQAKTLTAMLTFGDRALYFHAGRNFTFSGSIVDGGCFVGGTTINLTDGVSCNPRFDANLTRSKGLIRVYDQFKIDESYIEEWLRNGYPEFDLTTNDSFLPVFNVNMAGIKELLDVRAGDVMHIGYHDADDIEVFGVDLCKSLSVTDFIVRAFFPRLREGALVLQQDYIHEYHPYIHLSMAYLDDHFEKYLELEGGGSVAFKATRRISKATIVSRFGADASWYKAVDKNVALLKRLIGEMLYDYNKWSLMLTLGMYYLSCGLSAESKYIYCKASELYPQYKTSDLTRRLLIGKE